MKFLILGSGSFAGQIIFSEFLKRKYDVYGFNRSTPKDSYEWPWIEKYRSKLEGRWFQYNLVNDLESIIKHIAKLIGGETTNVDPVIEPRETLADNSKVKFFLGWEPKGNLEEWIKTYKEELGI